MNKDSSDFMITEYERISTAYFGLRDQVNEWFKVYLTLIGLPLTILAAVMRFSNDEVDHTLDTIPDIVAWLLLIVSILGFFVTISIISMRMEMILYARTINIVRRFFADKDKELHTYLVLPKTDSKPPYYEKLNTMFWQVLIMGILNGSILIVAILNITKMHQVRSVIIGVIFLATHWVIYFLVTRNKEKAWSIRFPEDLGHSQY